MPTYTSLLRVDRKLYAIYDFELPRPIGVLEAGVFVVTLFAVVIVARVLGLGFNATWGWVYVAVPLLAAWISGQPVADAKKAHSFLFSQGRFLAEPRTLTRLRASHEPRRMRLRCTVWQPRGAGLVEPEAEAAGW